MSWLLDKMTSGLGVAFGIIALIASWIAYVLFQAWSRADEKLKESEALRGFENKNRVANNEATTRVREQDKELEVKNEEFKDNTNNSSISDAIKLHNAQVQNPRD